MEEQKYKIGQTFFGACGTTAEIKIDWELINKCINIPAVFVVKEITINKKEIRYTIDKWLWYNDEDIKKTSITLTEKEMSNYFPHSLSEFISELSDKYTNRFNEITKKINKENLSAVLHGE